MKPFLKAALLLLTLSTSPLYAKLQGQARIDSLLKELPKQKEDTNKVNLLNALSKGYFSTNPDEGVKYGQQSVGLATKLAWKKGMAIATNILGVHYMYKNDYPKALEYYNEALKMFEEIGYKKGIAQATANMGLVYEDQSEYSKALEYFSKAMKTFEELGDKTNIAKQNDNIGDIYRANGDYPKALEYHFKSLRLSEEIGDKGDIAGCNDNIASVYFCEGDYPKALEYYLMALKYSEEIGGKRNVALTTGNIGNVYLLQHDYPKALEYYAKALAMEEEMGNKDGIIRNTSNISIIYHDQKNYTMAIDYAYRSLKIAEEIGAKYNVGVNLCNIGTDLLAIANDTTVKAANVAQTAELSLNKYLPEAGEPTLSIPRGKAAQLAESIDYLHRSLVIFKEIKALDGMQESYENLAKAYKLKGDYKNAMDYGDSLKVIKDSVFSEKNREKITQLETKRKEYADSLTTADAKIAADVKAQHRRNYELIGAGVLALALCFIFLLSRNNKLLGKEKKQSESLLHNILPEEVASQLKKTGAAAAKQFDNVTVLFTDFVNFTEAGERMKPGELIEELNNCFKAFDVIMGKYNIEKIKTIGDAYLAVAGLPTADSKHAQNVVNAAKEINAFMADRLAKLGNRTFEIRIGVHSGSVVAGIVGIKKFAYDIWGDTVNTAARMEQNSEAGKINISETTYELVKDKFSCEYRGEVAAKGKGYLKMYYVG